MVFQNLFQEEKNLESKMNVFDPLHSRIFRVLKMLLEFMNKYPPILALKMLAVMTTATLLLRTMSSNWLNETLLMSFNNENRFDVLANLISRL